MAALCHAAGKKGFAFVGSNSAGNNAFFVRRDVLGDVPSLSARDGWVDARFRESRDAAGNLTYIDGRAARLAAIADAPIVDVLTESVATIRDRLIANG